MSRAVDRSLTPALLVLLGGEVRDLAPALALAVARRSRRAARLVASVDASGRPGGLPRLFRAGVERVTDVRARAAALRAGYSVRDELLVLPTFALGGEAPSPDALRDALEAVVRLSTDFYRGTRVDVQALVLLPDLSADREARYARAYAQLAELDRAAGAAAPRLDGGPLLSRRWLCDCRTHTGAYAGRVADVIHPVAEFLSLMVVGSGAPEMDAAFEPALRAAAAGRSAGYSAPGYAEIGVRRSLLARYMACRLGAELAEQALRPPPDHGARAVEDRTGHFFTALAGIAVGAGVGAALRPLDPGCAGAGLDACRREQAHRRESLLHRAGEMAWDFGRSFAEEAGAQAGRWFIDSLREPHASTPLGPIRPPASVEGYRADGYALLREQLDPGRMRARAAALRNEADALVRPPLGEPDGEAAAEAMAARLERAAALRDEAERLLRRADRVEPLLAEPMQPEVLQALEEILLEDEPVSPPPDAPPAAEPSFATPPGSGRPDPGAAATAGFGGAAHSAFRSGGTPPPPPAPAPAPPKKRSWLARIVDWFTGRSGTRDTAATPHASTYEPPDFALPEDDPWITPDAAAESGDAAEAPAPAAAAPSVAPRLADVPAPPILPTMFALLGGNPSPMLVIEWLRWFAEFGAVLQGAVEEARRMEHDLNDLAAWYRAERDRALRELAVHGAFAHRVLSRPYLDLLFRQRRDALLAAFTPRLRETLRERFGSEADVGDAPSLMDFMQPDTPERSGLQRAVNHRFLGVDDDLEAAAREVFADWVEARLEPVLMDDPLVEGGGRPRDRLRAMADAARPLARPGIPPAPAAAEMALLPAGAESGALADALAEVAPSAQTVVTPDAERLSLRTVLHAYPAFALPQLRPVREASVHTAGGAPPYDPLPREALVRMDQDQVIAVGLAFGRVRRTDGGHALDPLPAERDEAVLVHRLSTTFAGWDAYQRLRGDLARELRAPDALDRLRGVLAEEGDGYSPEHRASLEAVAAALESGGWPDAFPFPDDA